MWGGKEAGKKGAHFPSWLPLLLLGDIWETDFPLTSWPSAQNTGFTLDCSDRSGAFLCLPFTKPYGWSFIRMLAPFCGFLLCQLHTCILYCMGISNSVLVLSLGQLLLLLGWWMPQDRWLCLDALCHWKLPEMLPSATIQTCPLQCLIKQVSFTPDPMSDPATGLSVLSFQVLYLWNGSLSIYFRFLERSFWRMKGKTLAHILCLGGSTMCMEPVLCPMFCSLPDLALSTQWLSQCFQAVLQEGVPCCGCYL